MAACALPNSYLIFQNRAAQETIIYKDEQLREAQAWVARAQLQSTTNQSLQAELRERTEQFNQHWLGYQRQVDYRGIFSLSVFRFLVYLLFTILIFSVFSRMFLCFTSTFCI